MANRTTTTAFLLVLCLLGSCVSQESFFYGVAGPGSGPAGSNFGLLMGSRGFFSEEPSPPFAPATYISMRQSAENPIGLDSDVPAGWIRRGDEEYGFAMFSGGVSQPLLAGQDPKIELLVGVGLAAVDGYQDFGPAGFPSVTYETESFDELFLEVGAQFIWKGIAILVLVDTFTDSPAFGIAFVQ